MLTSSCFFALPTCLRYKTSSIDLFRISQITVETKVLYLWTNPTNSICWLFLLVVIKSLYGSVYRGLQLFLSTDWFPSRKKGLHLCLWSGCLGNKRITTHYRPALSLPLIVKPIFQIWLVKMCFRARFERQQIDSDIAPRLSHSSVRRGKAN